MDKIRGFLRAIRPQSVPLTLFIVFVIVGCLVGLVAGPLLLANFVYIGAMLAIGMKMVERAPRKKKHRGRIFSLFAVGLWMFGFVGLVGRENMQLEGFWFVLFHGAFSGAVIHYSVAKILGPLVFGRSWCGWSCWTAMILDLLPFKRSPGRLPGKWGWLRYAHFALSFGLVALLWFGLSYRPALEFNTDLLLWFVAGNLLYYGLGIGLAYALKDNRAFCKYVCPVAVPLKVGTSFSLLKVSSDAESCTQCGACSKACPMDVDVAYYARQGLRVSSSECILCKSCIHTCPHGSLSWSFDLDRGDGSDHLFSSYTS